MKNLILLTLLVVGLSSAHARMPSVNDSFDRLDRTQGVIVDYPAFSFSDGRRTSVRGVCVAGDVLRSKRVKKTCVERRGGENDRCVKYRSKFSTKPMFGTTTYCARRSSGDNNDCVEYGTTSYSIARDYMIPVYRKSGFGSPRDNDERRGRLLFKKPYTIADCK